MTTLDKYMWLLNVLYKAGNQGMTLQEINQAWLDDKNVCTEKDIHRQKAFSRQTFDRWKRDILLGLHVQIDCHRAGGYHYYIKDSEIIRSGELTRWLLDTFSTAHILAQSIELKDRILTENTPSSHQHLTEIIQAMKENRIVELTHQGFMRSQPSIFPVAPYCLKMHQRRWYLLGLSLNDNKLRLYGLDRVTQVKLTEERFTLPENFDARKHFSTFFGVVMDEDTPEERIVLRADKYHQHYLRTLPLHPSQKEIFACDEYAEFELYLRPTYDFIMELLRAGRMIEVIEPQSLRKAMRGWISDMWELYKND